MGAIFWVAALLQDMFRHHRLDVLEHKSKVAGRGAGRLVQPHPNPIDPAHVGLRHRNSYAVTAVALASLSAYVFLGSYFNYRRADGYVEHVGWLLALASVVAAGALLFSLAAALTWLLWPQPPRWVRAVDAATPLSRSPLDLEGPHGLPSWELTAAALLTPSAAVVLSMLVATEWRAVVWFDERLADWFESIEWAGAFRFLDPMGSWVVALALFLGVALATLRCRPLAASYPLALGVAVLVTEVTGGIVERLPRGGTAPSTPDGYPSSHIVYATLLAGMVPLGVAALFGTKRFTMPLRVLLGIGVVGSASARIHDGLAWPSDAVAGALVGLTLVLWAQWAIDHDRWHRVCRGCTWAPSSHGPPLTGLVQLHVPVERALRLVAHLSAAVSVLILSVLTFTVGIPTSPDGTGFGLQVQVPVQIALIVIVSIGALVSWKWEAVGAVLMAVGGAGLAVFAAMEYRPRVAILVAVMFAVPAYLLWLAWQHRKTMAEILTVAVITTVLVGATWTGAVAANDYWFGATHPDSAAAFVGVDRVEWVWLGGLSDTGLTVTAGLAPGYAEATVVATPQDGGASQRSTTMVRSDEPAVRLVLSDLEPATRYDYHLEVDGERDQGRGQGTFETAPRGAASFSFAVSACARTGSNGAVFDAIGDTEPLFFLQLGDFHYANLESSDPVDHHRALTRQLTTAGQGALYRDVPMAYVWDDHDYGPNDADASSPSRDAARRSYRDMVPHYQLPAPDGGAIYQAFTVGRVRFVLTDTRSERTEATMVGDAQLAWLIDELTASAETHALVVWGNSVPWIGDDTAGGDNWNGYAAERRQIADALADNGVDNLVMVSGDAHMLGYDDGTNTDYSTSQAGGFPLLQAAALDRRGSVKGGPYSHPTFPGGGQFATVDVDDDGSRIDVTMTARTWDGEVLFEEQVSFAG